MSLVAQAFDAVLEQYQKTGHLTMEDLFGHMEPAFAAEGYREPVAQPQRILVVRLDEIGDCVLTIPFLRELRRAYPQAQIDLVVKSGPYGALSVCESCVCRGETAAPRASDARVLLLGPHVL